MLKINNLEVSTDGKTILKGFNLIINDGEIHAIMGPNGVGKSTLSRVIMGDSNYKINNGDIIFNGDNLSALSTDERAKKGIFLAMQYPMEIEGVSNQDFLRTAISSVNNKIIGLYYLDIPYNKWLKFIWKVFLSIFVVIIITSVVIYFIV